MNYFKCDLCEKSFDESHKLSSHTKKVHVTRQTCDICDLMVKDVAKHKEKEHFLIRNHKCKYCNKHYLEPSKLKYHLQDSHECDKCQSTFETSWKLKAIHM